jgi:predicted ATP-dependent serine protease
VGLTGELRYVAHAERRLQEAARFGLEQVIVPARCLADTAPDALAAAAPADSLASALGIALDPPALTRAA